MKSLVPYLIFPGTCREALEFYATCLDGDIAEIQTYEEAPIEFPAEGSDRIFNSVFSAGKLRFMASDCLPEQDLPPGLNFSMFVAFDDSEEQSLVFERFSAKGKVLMPLANRFGMVEDHFQIRWMLAYQDKIK